MDRVFAVHAEKSIARLPPAAHVQTIFPKQDQAIRIQCALSWKKWYQSGGRWLQCHWTSAVASAISNQQNCTCARKTQDKRTAPDVRSHGSIPLSLSGNFVTRIGIYLLIPFSFHDCKWPRCFCEKQVLILKAEWPLAKVIEWPWPLIMI